MRFRSYLSAISCCVLLVGASLVSCRKAATGEQGGVSARASTLARPSPTQQAAPPTLSEEEMAVNRRPLPLPLVGPRLVVRKGARRLTLYAGGEAVRVFPAALGFAPEGDKQRQGDGRTPEGEFYVCVKNERSAFHLSLGLSYPAADDAERGLREGLITRAEAARIARAIRRRGQPPWNTRLGGEIFIHGGGSQSDWTSGCVALENAHVKELFDSVPVGTTVRIEP